MRHISMHELPMIKLQVVIYASLLATSTQQE